jgi:hypothetical protein
MFILCDQTGSITEVTQVLLIALINDGHALLHEGTARITCGQWAATYDFDMAVYPSLRAVEFVLRNLPKALDGAFGYLTCVKIIVLPLLA